LFDVDKASHLVVEEVLQVELTDFLRGVDFMDFQLASASGMHDESALDSLGLDDFFQVVGALVLSDVRNFTDATDLPVLVDSHQLPVIETAAGELSEVHLYHNEL